MCAEACASNHSPHMPKPESSVSTVNVIFITILNIFKFKLFYYCVGAGQMGGLGVGLNNMASLAGVSSMQPTQSTISQAHSNSAATSSNLQGGVPAISAEQWQTAYSGIQQYVGKAVYVYFLHKRAALSNV